MFRTAAWLAVIVFAFAAAGCAPEYTRYHYGNRREVRDSLALMTKDDVIALTKSRIGDNVIINMINSSGSVFHLRTPDVIALADSGVSDTVITAMMKTDEPGGGGENSGGYNASYPPYYLWGVSPWWSPWYFSSYWGYWGGGYWPHYYHRMYAPYYGGFRYRASGGGGGGYRPSGRRR